MPSPRLCIAALLLWLAMASAATSQESEMPRPRTLVRAAKDTLTAIEMNRGDALRFTLRSGRTATLVPEATSARILERAGGTIYQFTCRIRFDGHPITLRRYVGSQESFYEPIVINGVRLWLDAVLDIFDKIPMRQIERQRVPHKHVRLALHDATMPICPQEMRPWYPNATNFINIKDCYNGDDCWLGAYLGRACHGGLDINQPKGDPLWAPIDFDDHWFFNSLAAGHNNNRWRGIRRWPNGDTWALQSHHLIKLLVPEHTPLKAGTHYAATAGVHVGSHTHTHFVFKVTPAEGGPEIHLDPWILFWQIFETRKAKAAALRPAIAPLAPVRTGQLVRFAPTRPTKGLGGSPAYTWTFGDGGSVRSARASHVFARPGIYPVTLVAEKGADRAQCTQHITVDGEPLPTPAIALRAPDELGFRPRPLDALDVYGWPVPRLPHTLVFVARPSHPVPPTRIIQLVNVGGGGLPKPLRPTVRYLKARGWLTATLGTAKGKHTLRVAVDAAGLTPGTYEAVVDVACPGAANSPQGFRVLLRVPSEPPASEATIDDRDPGFACTPWFWVGQRTVLCRRKGHAGFYLTNGGRPAAGEVARFTPDLAAGRYRVAFSPDAPFRPRTQFAVRVRHKGGDTTVRVQPSQSRVIGTFEFHEGADGFVELLAGGSKGLVIADAIVFERLR